MLRRRVARLRGDRLAAAVLGLRVSGLTVRWLSAEGLLVKGLVHGTVGLRIADSRTGLHPLCTSDLP